MKLLLRGGIVALGLTLGACAHGTRVTRAPRPEPPLPASETDATARLIAEADAHLAAGNAEQKQGHLVKAREEFDKAIDVYLTAPGGAYATPALGEAYRRTLDGIHLREIEALAAGDGFSEPLPEPASIDEVGELTVVEAPASEEARRTAEAAVQDEANDFPVELNDAVLARIGLYQGRLRDWFQAAMNRGGRYLPHIREVFAAEGIPQDLAYVALVESAFKTNALSRAKARGVWQFISATGKRYGLQQDWWVDERSDPEKATLAAAKYLKQLYAMFGDWNLALAGYNAGEYKVVRGIGRYGTKDFWSLAKTRAFRAETKNYVPMIHAAIVVAKSPERYGFVYQPEAAPSSERVGVAGAYDLRVVAECIDTPVEEIRALNPELRRLATPATRYDLRVPDGKGPALGECLAAIPPEKRAQFRTHVVARGQTLYAVAKRYGVRTQDLADANGLSLRSTLSIGTELIIPIEPRPASSVVRTASAGVTASPARPSPSSSRTRINYRIKTGDTLGEIASQYGTTVRELQSWNRLRSTRIPAGGLLTIYTSRKF